MLSTLRWLWEFVCNHVATSKHISLKKETSRHLENEYGIHIRGSRNVDIGNLYVVTEILYVNNTVVLVHCFLTMSDKLFLNTRSPSSFWFSTDFGQRGVNLCRYYILFYLPGT